MASRDPRRAPRPILTLTLALGALAAGFAAPLTAAAAGPGNRHFPAGTNSPAGASPPYSAAVLAGDTLYVAGTTDTDPDTGKLAPDAATGARVVMDKIKHAVEAGGMTMDDLVWVQVFATDLNTYAAFNTAYRSYFKGPMPARAFIGAGALLGGAHFEVMGVAAKAAK
ncbi:MAG: Endoribonuclease [Phenylobacterium sp.]|uniref:RidA family protein n=1 Tax=Phenylobacterium sp. TaxID=1871053 RepID=UPI0026210BEE|nr:Rid family hydrolase [Phenylobacterium sp.]MDB5498438.1 Endoribonuclease [Phenylobacterium sp.]